MLHFKRLIIRSNDDKWNYSHPSNQLLILDAFSTRIKGIRLFKILWRWVEAWVLERTHTSSFTVRLKNQKPDSFPLYVVLPSAHYIDYGGYTTYYGMVVLWTLSCAEIGKVGGFQYMFHVLCALLYLYVVVLLCAIITTTDRFLEGFS